MNRYYFFKRTKDLRDDLRGDIIDFSLSALYSTREFSQRNQKEISQFHYFDQIHLCISTKTAGIFQVEVDSGTDGCMGHYAKSLIELKQSFEKDGYSLVNECEYFRLRRFAMRLIFQKIKFFVSEDDGAERKYLYQNDFSRSFYDIKLISTSQKYNIRNYDEKQIEYAKSIDLPMHDLRIDEDFRIFISKDKNYKSTKFQIESSYFNPYYENYEKFLSAGFFGKHKRTSEIKDFQFDRLKRKIIELIFDRSDLDISSILPRQEHTITILDI